VLDAQPLAHRRHRVRLRKRQHKKAERGGSRLTEALCSSWYVHANVKISDCCPPALDGTSLRKIGSQRMNEPNKLEGRCTSTDTWHDGEIA